MPALRKPHRIAFLAPDLAVEGSDAAYTAELGLLLWSGLIEVCQRHPGLAVYDPESTPLFPRDGHFVPQHAIVGATPDDAFYATTRRDELVWLELRLPKASAVRLHALARDGTRESFDALGRNVGEQIHQVLGAWLTARQLPALPRRFEAVTADELCAAVRVFGPLLVEQARLWTAPAATHVASVLDDADEEANAPEVHPAVEPRARVRFARSVANRLTPALRVAALRVLELALGEDLADLILAHDRDHPQAVFAKYLAAKAETKDFALLRRAIAAAPCWARPLGELVDDDEDEEAPLEPTTLETVAAAGIAALCRPAHLDVIERVADHLRDDGRADEALRLMQRAMQLHHDEARAHISLLHLHRATDRVGAWLAQAHRSGSVHGCPMDPALPWYPDQIQIDLLVADALMACGRLDEAIALRANRLEGREATWPRHTRILETWRKDPRFVAWCYAREGFFRGDPARAIEGFGRIEPADSLDLAIFLDSLVAMGHEDDVLLAWAHFGLGRGLDGPVARLAAARCLMAAGEWRRGLEELWRVQLTEPGRDEHAAIARCGLLMSVMPIEVAETALAERLSVGAHTLARRMARDVADFVPAAAKSSIVLRALGLPNRPVTIEHAPGALAASRSTPRAARRSTRCSPRSRPTASPSCSPITSSTAGSMPCSRRRPARTTPRRSRTPPRTPPRTRCRATSRAPPGRRRRSPAGCARSPARRSRWSRAIATRSPIAPCRRCSGPSSRCCGAPTAGSAPRGSRPSSAAAGSTSAPAVTSPASCATTRPSRRASSAPRRPRCCRRRSPGSIAIGPTAGSPRSPRRPAGSRSTRATPASTSGRTRWSRSSRRRSSTPTTPSIPCTSPPTSRRGRARSRACTSHACCSRRAAARRASRCSPLASRSRAPRGETASSRR
jgi:hypothetical protein